MRIRLASSLGMTALLASVCWGCGSGGSGKLPDLIPVKGKVSYKGKPLTKGTIRFEPDGFGRMATGKLKDDGTYELSTLKEGDGVVAGHHKVYITGTGPTPTKEVIPKKYLQANSSKLEVDVDTEHTEFPFELQ